MTIQSTRTKIGWNHSSKTVSSSSSNSGPELSAVTNWLSEKVSKEPIVAHWECGSDEPR